MGSASGERRHPPITILPGLIAFSSWHPGRAGHPGWGLMKAYSRFAVRRGSRGLQAGPPRIRHRKTGNDFATLGALCSAQRPRDLWKSCRGLTQAQTCASCQNPIPVALLSSDPGRGRRHHCRAAAASRCRRSIPCRHRRLSPLARTPRLAQGTETRSPLRCRNCRAVGRAAWFPRPLAR